jgi:hypothetical protein
MIFDRAWPPASHSPDLESEICSSLQACAVELGDPDSVAGNNAMHYERTDSRISCRSIFLFSSMLDKALN